MRVIVAGCRTWTDGGIVAQKLHAIISRKGPITVVHGACPTGADYYASRFAIGCSSATEERHAADWGNRGAKAGPERNERMAAAGADLLLAFWDGQSPGTLDMIRRAVAHCIPVQIVANGATK